MRGNTALWSDFLGLVGERGFGRSGGRAGNLLLDSKFPGAGGVDRSFGPRGRQGEKEAGLENLVFNSKFPRFGWERAPFRWNTRCGLARSGMTCSGRGFVDVEG